MNIFSYIFILEPLPYLFYFHGYYCNYIPFSVLSPLILLKHQFFHHIIVCPMVFPCVSRFLHFLKMGVPLFFHMCFSCVFHCFSKFLFFLFGLSIVFQVFPMFVMVLTHGISWHPKNHGGPGMLRSWRATHCAWSAWATTVGGCCTAFRKVPLMPRSGKNLDKTCTMVPSSYKWADEQH